MSGKGLRDLYELRPPRSDNGLDTQSPETEGVGMCHRPTIEETARSEARKAATAPADEERREPWTYPEPRGNGDSDRGEVERGSEKLATVLGH